MKPMSPEDHYANLTNRWLNSMGQVKATQEQYLEGLRAALEELEVSIQACKETM